MDTHLDTGGEMNIAEQRLRWFLLCMSGIVLAGALIELSLVEHTESTLQLLPFFLCGAGLVMLLIALLRPGRTTFLMLRGVMAVVAIGSLFGIYEHVEHNIEFAMEIRPSAAFSQVLLEGLKGANPLLAPGMIGIAAVLAIAATYAHPLIKRS